MSTAATSKGGRLRVLHLIDNLGADGGAQQSLAQLAVVLLEHGIDCSVVALDGRITDGLAPSLRSDGIDVSMSGGRGGRVGDVVRVTRMLRQRQPDLLHTSLHAANIVGRFAGLFARVPVVTSVVSTKTDAGASARSTAFGRGKGVVSRRLGRATGSLVRRFHAVSPSAAQHAVRDLGVAPHRVDVVSRGRDRSRLGDRNAVRRTAVRATLGLGDDDVVVLAVGRHVPEKAFDVLIAALPTIVTSIPTAVLLIAGAEGVSTSALVAQIGTLDLSRRVRLLGHRSDLGDLHTASDVYVLSSRLEGMPGALLEALAIGTPAVVTDIGPALDVVDATCALVVPVESAELLAAAVVAVIADPNGAQARVEAGYQRFSQEFDLDSVASRMRVFYERALAG
jgi:glycosyltransferase involved in cell wall biosynthesis